VDFLHGGKSPFQKDKELIALVGRRFENSDSRLQPKRWRNSINDELREMMPLPCASAIGFVANSPIFSLRA
jgi:hypothetical protein